MRLMGGAIIYPFVTTRAQLVLLGLALSFGCGPALAQHAVPKDRAALQDRDWLPYVVSKIAPLERWSFASSSSDLKREDFISDFQYEQAKSDLSFPRFCFVLFRPRPQQMASLISAVGAYKSEVNWVMADDCIVAIPAMPELKAPATVDEQEKFHALLYKATHPDAEFVKQALRDSPSLAAFIEARLNLRGRPSLEFDPSGLRGMGWLPRAVNLRTIGSRMIGKCLSCVSRRSIPERSTQLPPMTAIWQSALPYIRSMRCSMNSILPGNHFRGMAQSFLHIHYYRSSVI
jgi:hypothetical protein